MPKDNIVDMKAIQNDNMIQIDETQIVALLKTDKRLFSKR